MSVFVPLLRKESKALFSSPVAWALIAVFLLLMGFSFAATLFLTKSATLIHVLFQASVLLLLIIPVITMRLFALEKFSGTYETLMTTPVGDLQVVLAKFFAALAFYVIALLPLFGALEIVRHYTAPGSGFDGPLTATTFGGLVLIGATYLAMGCLASALTRSQIIAATISFALGVCLFLVSFLRFSLGTQAGAVADVVNYLSLFTHMEDFVRGVIDTRPLVFHLGLTGLLLFLNLKVVESRRWK